MLDILNLNLGTLNVTFSLYSVTGDISFCQEENVHKVYANTVKSTANLDENPVFIVIQDFLYVN